MTPLQRSAFSAMIVLLTGGHCPRPVVLYHVLWC